MQTNGRCEDPKPYCSLDPAGHASRAPHKREAGLALPDSALAGTSGEGLDQNEVSPQIQCSRRSRARPDTWALHIRVVRSHCVSLPTAQGSCPTALGPQHKCLTPLKDIKRSWASAIYLTPKYPCQARACLLLGTKVTHRVGWGQLSAGQTPPLVTGYTTQGPGCPPACSGRLRQTAVDPSCLPPHSLFPHSASLVSPSC